MWDELGSLQKYNEHGRLSLRELYCAFDEFKRSGFQETTIYSREIEDISLVTRGFRSLKQGPAIWVIAGIHGEEPAGSNAIARNVSLLCELAQKYPLVVLPLANPNGYRQNWRYPDCEGRKQEGVSVGSSEHYLLATDGSKARRETPENGECAAFTAHSVSLFKEYRPVLVIDLHEDEDLEGHHPYIYSQGKLGGNDPIGREIVNILREQGVSFDTSDVTSFGQPIVNGVVGRVHDGSIDELLASEKYFLDGNVVEGPAATTVIVVETPTVGMGLEARITAQTQVLQRLEQFAEMVFGK